MAKANLPWVAEKKKPRLTYPLDPWGRDGIPSSETGPQGLKLSLGLWVAPRPRDDAQACA